MLKPPIQQRWLQNSQRIFMGQIHIRKIAEELMYKDKDTYRKMDKRGQVIFRIKQVIQFVLNVIDQVLLRIIVGWLWEHVCNQVGHMARDCQDPQEHQGSGVVIIMITGLGIVQRGTILLEVFMEILVRQVTFPGCVGLPEVCVPNVVLWDTQRNGVGVERIVKPKGT